VWVHGGVHEQEHVALADRDKGKQLKSMGYRVVTIWTDSREEGLHDLAVRLGRPDLA